MVVPNPATGKLHWAKNGETVDTTPDQWKDSGDGSGIIKVEFQELENKSNNDTQNDNSSISSESSTNWSSFSMSESDSDLDPEEAQRKKVESRHYFDNENDKRHHKVTHRFTTHGMMDRLLRKTIGKNTWIYVSYSYYNFKFLLR